MTLNGLKWGYASIAAVIAVLVLRYAVLSLEAAKYLQTYFGYYAVLAVFACWCWLVLQAVTMSDLRLAVMKHWKGLLLVLLGAFFLHIHEPHVFRILYDEPSHVAGSLMMHQERMAVLPGRAHMFYGSLVFADSFPAFRLYFFQVLLSLVHDVSGYRPENVFWLNGFLTVVFLTLVYLVGNVIGGKRGGAIMVVLLCSLPLLAQNVTSGGYDVLNLVMLAALFLAANYYIKSPGVRGLDLMVITSVLLALTRYESIAYTLIPLGAAVYKWRKEGVWLTTPLTVVSPLLLLPSLVANLILFKTEAFTANEITRNLHLKYFDLAYLPSNLSNAVYYFFSVDTDSTNSVLLSLLGLLGLVLLCMRFFGWAFRRGQLPILELLILGFSGITLGLYALVLTHYWGMPTDLAAARFTLPVQLVFALSAVWLFMDIFRREMPVLIPVGAGVFLLLLTVPANSKHTASNRMVVGRSYEWFVDYARKHSNNGRTLFVSKSNLPMLIYGLPSINLGTLNVRKQEALKSIQAKVYDEIIVHEMFWISPRDGSLNTNMAETLSSDFEVETISESKCLPDQISRIVKIKGVKTPDGLLMPSTMEPLKVSFRDKEEQIRYLYGLLP